MRRERKATIGALLTAGLVALVILGNATGCYSILKKAQVRELSARTHADLGLELIPIKPGSFTMGENESVAFFDNSDEGPAHKVTLTYHFWIGRTEVTQSQYEAVMGVNWSDFKGKNNPVEQVSWHNAVEFCRRLTKREQSAGRLPFDQEYRLPTEAEWEYCCRAGTTTSFSFGTAMSDLEKYAVYDGTPKYGRKTTAPVASLKPNAWGLHDMHGNVWEWCSDWYGSYSGKSQTDPTGPKTGKKRVIRGGSWINDGRKFCRSAKRSALSPSICSNALGFRIVQSYERVSNQHQ